MPKAKTAGAPKKNGRPSSYSDQLAEVILSLLMEGQSLRNICAEDAMPDRTTVIRWLADNEHFASKYAHAREAQADLMDEKILEVADKCTSETAQADRVKIAAYQWRASKLAPKKYGDKLALAGDSDSPLVVKVIKFGGDNPS